MDHWCRRSHRPSRTTVKACAARARPAPTALYFPPVPGRLLCVDARYGSHRRRLCRREQMSTRTTPRASHRRRMTSVCGVIPMVPRPLARRMHVGIRDDRRLVAVRYRLHCAFSNARRARPSTARSGTLSVARAPRPRPSGKVVVSPCRRVTVSP